MSNESPGPPTPVEARTSETSPLAARKGPPFWAGLLFVALLGGGYAVTQYINYSGPPIQWRNDYDAALAEAKSAKKRLFLLLHEPGCPMTRANERELLSTRFVRERLAEMVSCRIELKISDPLAQKLEVTELPTMLCIDPAAGVLGRLQGRVAENQFRTYVHPK